MKKLLANATIAAAITGGALAGAGPAAAANQTITAEISCINWLQQYSKPVGVWVDVSKGTDGWARLSQGVGAKGSTTTNLSYTANDPGQFTLHIGCGGTSQKWGANIKQGPFNAGNRGRIDVRYW